MKISEIRAKFPMYADVPERDLVRGLHDKFYADMPYREFLSKIDFRPTIDPTKDMSEGQKFSAGVGKAMYDVGQGAQQLVGLGESGEETKNRRALDKPLMQTGAGLAGNIASNITMLAPLAVVPGGATVGGAAALGVLSGAMQPTEGPQERRRNMALGGVLGGAAQAAMGPGARALGEWGANREAAAALRKSQNAGRDQTLAAAQTAGYTVPGSAVNSSTFNKVLESVAGKAAVGQEAAIRNQGVTNKLAREALDMPPGQALSEGILRDYRKAVSEPYREVAAISKRAEMTLEQLKDARFNANNYSKHYAMSADPNSLAAAKNFSQKADALEQALEGFAAKGGKPDLIEALRKARQQIAKSYDVERALNVGTGDVSAKILGRALDKGKPLSGGLETAGRFAEAFGPYARDAASIPTPGVSKLGAVLSGGMGAGGFAAGGPAGLAAAAVPFTVPPAARSLALALGKSVKPDYSIGAGTQAAAALNDPETRRRLAMMARALALPAAVQEMP